jgi:hypothetical protein
MFAWTAGFTAGSLAPTGQPAGSLAGGAGRRRRPRLAQAGIAGALLLLSGCATSPATDVEKTWIGRNTDELIRAWGAPDDTARTGDGATLFSYRYRSAATKRTALRRTCEATFLVSPADVILDAHLEGNASSCRDLRRMKS